MTEHTKQLVMVAALVFVASNWSTFVLASEIDLDELQKSGASGASTVVALFLYRLFNRE